MPISKLTHISFIHTGILTHGPVLETPIEDVSAIFDTNVSPHSGCLSAVDAALELMYSLCLLQVTGVLR